MKSLRSREGKELAQGHTLSQGQSRGKEATSEFFSEESLVSKETQPKVKPRRNNSY